MVPRRLLGRKKGGVAAKKGKTKIQTEKEERGKER